MTQRLLKAAMVALTALVLVSPVAAAEPEGINELTDAQLADLTVVARDEGITLEQAIERYSWHESFAGLLSDLRLEFPTDYAGGSTEGANPWVGFRSALPAAAANRIFTFQRAIDVRENLGFGEAQVEDRLQQVHYSVAARSDLIDAVTSDYDIATGAITVAVKPKPGSGSNVVQALRTTLPAESAQWSVTITAADDLELSDDATIYGGGPLVGCTAGFTVTDGFVRGISTAAHCSNSQSYSGTSLRFQWEHSGRYGDVQWHRGNATFSNYFYINAGIIRPATATRFPSTGQQLCRYGRTTGQRCDTVKARYKCNGSRCGLVAMNHRYAAGGDSGGPWFWGNTAYGIHQGAIRITFVLRDVFTPVANFYSALGVVVATV